MNLTLTIALAITLQVALPTETEWKTQVPTSAGWRTVTPGMTVDDLLRTLKGEVEGVKRVNYSDGTTGSETKLRKKIKVDGIDYEVKFNFDADKHLRTIVFFSNKVKKETFAEVTAALAGFRGEATNKDVKTFPDGSSTQTTSWQNDDATLNVTYATIPLGGFMTGRIVTVVTKYTKKP